MAKQLPSHLEPFIKVKYSKIGITLLTFLVLLTFFVASWQIYLVVFRKTETGKATQPFFIPFLQNLKIIPIKTPIPTLTSIETPQTPQTPQVTLMLAEFTEPTQALTALAGAIEQLKAAGINTKVIEGFYNRAKEFNEQGSVEKALQEANTGYNLAQELLLVTGH